jgi:lactoylglutathione lyase
MEIEQSGIILFMERYEEAVEFYTTRLGLPVRERKEHLTILDFGHSYLMVEENGVAAAAEKSRAQNPAVLRIDVLDFEQTVEQLNGRGVGVSVHRFDWGTIGVIIDPEGNRIELKEAV